MDSPMLVTYPALSNLVLILLPDAFRRGINKNADRDMPHPRFVLAKSESVFLEMIPYLGNHLVVGEIT